MYKEIETYNDYSCFDSFNDGGIIVYRDYLFSCCREVIDRLDAASEIDI